MGRKNTTWVRRCLREERSRARGLGSLRSDPMDNTPSFNYSSAIDHKFILITQQVSSRAKLTSANTNPPMASIDRLLASPDPGSAESILQKHHRRHLFISRLTQLLLSLAFSLLTVHHSRHRLPSAALNPSPNSTLLSPIDHNQIGWSSQNTNYPTL
ncbi:hypothetical protein M0R45_018401 [Rubus argutus]|uniref:Uncharacterized protein n=1 Tax=Rubus argutus TaxID=59490 RepID=A0AAW1X4Y4_RUBAR